MCLSPEVDSVASVTIDALRHNKSLRSLPLALVPTVFAMHTLSSAFIWWSHRGQVSPWVGAEAANFFIAIAFAFLPIYIPFAVWCIEPAGQRRNVLTFLCLAGLFSGLTFAQGIARGEASAVVGHHYIDYHVQNISPVAMGCYFIATCGAMLFSGYRALMAWGVLNVAVVVFLYWWMYEDLPSIWCFWAGATSGFVAWFLRSDDLEPRALSR